MANELYHHGILGQKWGIRRYQNPDGTYTEEGKRRYNVKDYKRDRKALTKQREKELKRASVPKAQAQKEAREYADQILASRLGETKIDELKAKETAQQRVQKYVAITLLTGPAITLLVALNDDANDRARREVSEQGDRK